MELERARRLAKALAKMAEETVGLWKNADGTYEFCILSQLIDSKDKNIEYITPY